MVWLKEYFDALRLPSLPCSPDDGVCKLVLVILLPVPIIAKHGIGVSRSRWRVHRVQHYVLTPPPLQERA